MKRFPPLLSLALASAWNRRLTLGLTLLAIALASALLLSVERLRENARASYANALSGTDLIVGARGSGLQLVLHAVFRVGEPVAPLRWESYAKLAADPAVAWSVPLSLGDSHRGFPVLGTNADYFRHYRHGAREALRFSAGEPFAELFETVLGADVAARLGYRVGDTLTLSHGVGGVPGLEHADKPFRIVGILAPTGSPVDRTLHISLEAMEAIHLDWQAGAPIPGFNIAPELATRFDLTPKTISAALIGLHQRTSVFAVQRKIAAWPGEALQAVLPGVVLDQLWEYVGNGERLLDALAWLILGSSLAGLAAVLLAGLGERRRELAILRAVGAGPRHIAALLLIESAALGLAGAGIGLAAVVAASAAAGPTLALHWGIHLASPWPSAGELARLAAIVATTALAGLWPAWRAFRLALADGLTPRL